MLSVSAHSVGVLAFSTTTATASVAKEQTGVASIASAAPAPRQIQSCQCCIDISRIGAIRQAHQPIGNFSGGNPAPMYESEAFAKRGFECPIADCGTTRHTGAGDVTLDGGEFERQRRHRR